MTTSFTPRRRRRRSFGSGGFGSGGFGSGGRTRQIQPTPTNYRELVASGSTQTDPWPDDTSDLAKSYRAKKALAAEVFKLENSDASEEEKRAGIAKAFRGNASLVRDYYGTEDSDLITRGKQTALSGFQKIIGALNASHSVVDTAIGVAAGASHNGRKLNRGDIANAVQNVGRTNPIGMAVDAVRKGPGRVFEFEDVPQGAVDIAKGIDKNTQNPSQKLASTVTGIELIRALKGNPFPGGSAIGSVLGFGHDLASDPLSYLSLGTGSLGKKGASTLAADLVQRANVAKALELGTSDAIQFTRQPGKVIAKKGLDEARIAQLMNDEGIDATRAVASSAYAKDGFSSLQKTLDGVYGKGFADKVIPKVGKGRTHANLVSLRGGASVRAGLGPLKAAAQIPGSAEAAEALRINKGLRALKYGPSGTDDDTTKLGVLYDYLHKPFHPYGSEGASRHIMRDAPGTIWEERRANLRVSKDARHVAFQARQDIMEAGRIARRGAVQAIKRETRDQWNRKLANVVEVGRASVHFKDVAEKMGGEQHADEYITLIRRGMDAAHELANARGIDIATLDDIIDGEKLQYLTQRNIFHGLKPNRGGAAGAASAAKHRVIKGGSRMVDPLWARTVTVKEGSIEGKNAAHRTLFGTNMTEAGDPVATATGYVNGILKAVAHRDRVESFRRVGAIADVAPITHLDTYKNAPNDEKKIERLVNSLSTHGRDQAALKASSIVAARELLPDVKHLKYVVDEIPFLRNPKHAMPVEIHTILNNAADPHTPNNLAAAINWAMGAWSRATLSTTGTTFRRTLGELYNATVHEGVTPKDLALGERAVRALRAANGDITQVTDKKVEKILENALEYDILGGSYYRTHLGIDKIRWKKLGRDANRRPVDTLQRINFTVASRMEDAVRIASFHRGMESGLSPYSARLRVGRFHFYNHELTETERRYARPMIPFYSFLRNNTMLQVETMLRNPGKIGLYGKFVENAQAEEEGPFPLDWATETGGFAIPDSDIPMLGLGKRDDGAQRYMINNIADVGGLVYPIQAATALSDVATGRGGNQFLGNMNPFLRTGIQAITNKDLFTGREYDAVSDDPAEDAPTGLYATDPFRRIILGLQRHGISSDRFTSTLEDSVPWLRILSRANPTSAGREEMHGEALLGMSFGPTFRPNTQRLQTGAARGRTEETREANNLLSRNLRESGGQGVADSISDLRTYLKALQAVEALRAQGIEAADPPPPSEIGNRRKKLERAVAALRAQGIDAQMPQRNAPFGPEQP